MTAYGIEERFKFGKEQRPDPGTYQHCTYHSFQKSKAPFLSKKPRNTSCGLPVWTEALYNADIPSHIPNCTSLRSTKPRFAYEAFTQEDLEELLCRCGLPNPCECPTADETSPAFICQRDAPKRLFKGPPPHSVFVAGLSCPSRNDRGFEALADGRYKRVREEIVHSPKFYDADVKEFTRHYHGWKWSRRTSKRDSKPLEERPGPADYTIMREVTPGERCAQEVRHQKRKTAKLYRYIEMVQQMNLRDGRPGPATYSPTLPNTDFVTTLGPKRERFITSKYDISPGPADYMVPRAYDLPPELNIQCHAKLPHHSTFGIANRFKPLEPDGPSPASYEARYNPKNVCCSKAPFGVSSKRFSSIPIDDDEEEDPVEECPIEDQTVCPKLSWMFKSTAVRMKLSKDVDIGEPWQPKSGIQRCSPKIQYIKPFNSSEGRFQPWYNWFPCHNKLEGVGPGCYCLDKPRCLPAVNGPIYRAARFQSSGNFSNPPPGNYDINREFIKKTHNNRLNENINNKRKFEPKIPEEPVVLSYEQKTLKLLDKAIEILDDEYPENPENTEIPEKPAKPEKIKPKKIPEEMKPKLLRCFLYKNQLEHCL